MGKYQPLFDYLIRFDKDHLKLSLEEVKKIYLINCPLRHRSIGNSGLMEGMSKRMLG